MKNRITHFIYLFCLIVLSGIVNAQVVTVGSGTLLSVLSPFNGTTPYGAYEAIYNQTEINTNGAIFKFAFWKQDGTDIDPIQNVKIYMKHTTATSLPTTTLDTSGYTLVYTGNYTNIAGPAWMEVTLDNAFLYDNINNLQLLITKNNSPVVATTPVAARYYYATITGGARRYNSATPLSSSSSLAASNVRANIQIEFAPPVPPVCAINMNPMPAATNVCPTQTLLSWSQGVGSPAFDYLVYLGTDGGGVTTPTNIFNGVLTTNPSQVVPGGLLDNTTYYWQIIPQNISGQATGCGIESFTTGTGLTVGTASTSIPGICQSGSLDLIMSTYTGNLQWEMYNGSSWVADGAPNTNPYTVSPSINTDYRGVISNPSCSGVNSNMVTVSVSPLSVAGTASISTDTVCAGNQVILDVTGHTGSIQWQWYNGSNWVDINGANTAFYQFIPSDSGDYRAAVTSGGCATVYTNMLNLLIESVSNPVANSAAICGPGIVNLSVSGPGIISWYPDTLGSAAVNTGLTYNPALTNTKTWYTQAHVGGSFYNVGPANNGIGTQSAVASTNWGMQFNATESATIERVYIYPAATGSITINLRQSAGGPILASKSMSVTAFTGKTAVTLNFPVNPGTGYRLELETGSAQLYRNTTGASYPYTVAGSPISIVGYFNPNFASGVNYLWFYDWNVSTGCKSAFVPVTGTVNQIPATPTINAAGNNLTSSSSIGNQWFLNGNPIPGAINQIYAATAAGNYTVQVTINNCVSAISNSFVYTSVQNINEALIRVYPNPVIGNLFINTGISNGELKITLYDATGRNVFSKLVFTTGTSQDVELDLTKLSEGMYILQAEGNNSNFRQRINVLK